VIQTAKIHIIYASSERGTHYVQIPIILRAIQQHIVATRQVRKTIQVSDVRKKSTSLAAAESARYFISAASIEVRHSNFFHFAYTAEIVNHRAPHHPRAQNKYFHEAPWCLPQFASTQQSESAARSGHPRSA
jgi:hypothetical protein